MATSDSGIWVTDGGEVVYEQPRGGSTQIVAPGGEVGGAAKARLEQLGVTLDEETAEPAAPTEEQPGVDDLTVTTKNAAPRKRAAKKSS